MTNRQSVSLVRITDVSGAQLVMACVPEGSADLVCMGEEDSWTETCLPVTSVVIDLNGIVQLTDSRDVAALSAWLGAASVWLKMLQMEGGEDDDRDPL